MKGGFPRARTPLPWLLGVALVAVVTLVYASASATVGLVSEALPALRRGAPDLPEPQPSLEIPPGAPPRPGAVEPFALPPWLAAVGGGLLLLGIAAGVALLGYAVVRALRRLPRLSRTAPEEQPRLDPLADLPAGALELAAGSPQRRRLLREGTPAEGIIACWSALEVTVAGIGMRRDPASTSTEYTAAVLASWPVDQTAITGLAELYREARYSRHPMGEAARARAEAYLDRLDADLTRLATARPGPSSHAPARPATR